MNVGNRAVRAVIVVGLLECCFALSGCGGPTPTPIVDMTGVDLAVYNRDLAGCVKQEAAKLIVLGNGVTRCMMQKGYRILVGY